MEKGDAAVKHLVMRVSIGVEDDTFLKRLEEGAPVGAEEGASGMEESSSGTEEGICGMEESALL